MNLAITSPLIGIAGRMRSGKSTLARAIERQLNRLGRHSSIIPFSKPLKEVALSMGWNGKKDEQGRKLLQVLATEVGRECIDPDIWVKKWLQLAQPLLAHPSASYVIIADDVRFENEVQTILEAGGLLVKMKRKQVEPAPRPFLKRWTKRREHVSETPLPDEQFHIIIDNDGAISDLVVIAETLAKRIKTIYGDGSCTALE